MLYGPAAVKAVHWARSRILSAAKRSSQLAAAVILTYRPKDAQHCRKNNG
jgi:hypothetical protein